MTEKPSPETYLEAVVQINELIDQIAPIVDPYHSQVIIDACMGIIFNVIRGDTRCDFKDALPHVIKTARRFHRHFNQPGAVSGAQRPN